MFDVQWISPFCIMLLSDGHTHDFLSIIIFISFSFFFFSPFPPYLLLLCAGCGCLFHRDGVQNVYTIQSSINQSIISVQASKFKVITPYISNIKFYIYTRMYIHVQVCKYPTSSSSDHRSMHARCVMSHMGSTSVYLFISSVLHGSTNHVDLTCVLARWMMLL